MLAWVVPNPEATFVSRVTGPVTVLLSSSAPQTQLMAPGVVPQIPIKGKEKFLGNRSEHYLPSVSSS